MIASASLGPWLRSAFGLCIIYYASFVCRLLGEEEKNLVHIVCACIVSDFGGHVSIIICIYVWYLHVTRIHVSFFQL